MSVVGIFIEVAVLVFLIFVSVFMWKLLVQTKKEDAFTDKRNLFQWHFDKLLLAYEVKVLKDEIKKRNISMESLNDIMNEALETKISNKHVLDEIEEKVKGEVKKASSK